MRIFSKYKDYYDYLTGIYGIDNKCVVDRREGEDLNRRSTIRSRNEGLYKIIQLAVCDKLYTGAVDHEGKIYWGNEMLEIGEPMSEKSEYGYGVSWTFKNFTEKYGHKDAVKIKTEKFYGWRSKPYIVEETVSLRPEKTGINKSKECPILFMEYEWNDRYDKWPMLASLDFGRVVPAHDMFVALSNWIGQTMDMDVPNNMTDIEKVQSHGFDNKKSFRHRK